MQKRIPGRAGYTLVELLVAISVVGALVVVLLPALGSTRQAAQAINCLSNMRQLTLATGAYVADYKDRFPQPFHDRDIEAAAGTAAMGAALWFNAVDPYLGQARMDYSDDPADRHYHEVKQDPVWGAIPESERLDNRTIKMNDHFGHAGGGTYRFHRGRDVGTPARTVLYVDGRAYDLVPSTNVTARSFHAVEGTVGLRHDDGANVAFPDGHAEHVWQELRTTTAAPSWFSEPDPLQTLIWDFTRR